MHDTSILIYSIQGRRQIFFALVLLIFSLLSFYFQWMQLISIILLLGTLSFIGIAVYTFYKRYILQKDNKELKKRNLEN